MKPLTTRLRAAVALLRNDRSGFADAKRQHPDGTFTTYAQHELAKYDAAIAAVQEAIKSVKDGA